MHERGVVHRDVKPSNILRTPAGGTKLGDFGIAQLRDAATLTVSGTMLGTVSYMAPEQLEDHQVGPSADLWSLGIVLLECLTGRRAYEGTPSEIVARRLRALVPLPADLPVPWKLVLAGMLDHRPDERLSGHEVAALLATSAFQMPWRPTVEETSQGRQRVATYDLTALASVGDEAASARTVVANDDRTRILQPKAVRSKAARSKAPAWRRARALPLWTLVIAIVALALVGLALGLWLVPGATNDTTTTLPAASTALSNLVSDMAHAQLAGRMDSSTEQAIATDAEQAVAHEKAGNGSQAGNNLADAEQAIVSGLEGGTMTQGEAVQLLHDVAVLSVALKVTIPPTTTTTTTTTTSTTTTTVPNPNPGGGPGNGNGGGGNGNGF